MAIKRYFWRSPLRITTRGILPCPSCISGKLALLKDALHFKSTVRSQRSWDKFEPPNVMDIEYTFSATFKCSTCQETVSCCGHGGVEPVARHDEEGYIHYDDVDTLFPLYFFPPLIIFIPPHRTPEFVQKRLRESFALFFCSKSASLNCARQCVEEILNDKGIEKLDTKGRPVTLKTRIDRFVASQPDEAENADRADALRWLGNVGSHAEKVSVEDVFDAYDILEVLLEDLYVGHRRSVRDIVNAVNAKKGSRHA